MAGGQRPPDGLSHIRKIRHSRDHILLGLGGGRGYILICILCHCCTFVIILLQCWVFALTRDVTLLSQETSPERRYFRLHGPPDSWGRVARHRPDLRGLAPEAKRGFRRSAGLFSALWSWRARAGRLFQLQTHHLSNFMTLSGFEDLDSAFRRSTWS